MAEQTRSRQDEPLEGDPTSTASPFHEGEQRIQSRLGVREEIEPWARQVIHDSLPDQHREFYAQLPFLVVAARDEQGQPWVTLLAGEPGFAHSENPAELAIETTPALGDPLHGALRSGADIGVLGIEPHTRRRNRVNGRVGEADDAVFRLEVEQSFGNCPKYITERVAHYVDASPRASQVQRSTSLSHTAQQCIAAADTFFIATGYRGRGESVSYGMDASHRGGPQGFVRVLDEHTLVFDDYAGNNHYNTLGNLSMDPRSSLLFVDFARGGLLHLRGRARIEWQAAQRTIRFELDEVIERPYALPLRWSDPLAFIRKLRVAAIHQESADVRSLVFEPEDGGPLEPFLAGQYLPVSLSIPGRELAAERTYSLSNSPGDEHYRISVKRESQGLVSQYLHDQVQVGDVLTTGTPSGSFVLETGSTRPAVLLSAGVGLTPMVAMLHELAGTETPVVFVHGARDAQHHSLREEVRAVADAHANVELHVRYSRPGVSDVKGLDYDSSGRLDAELLERLLPGFDANFYLCGPAAFLADLQQALRRAGVPTGQIHTESF
jgi:ferredoxin-NADP reductase/predicted pyridoxine 5'-phosphate oxidase superfamily flavin-nucleotide-binding protein